MIRSAALPYHGSGVPSWSPGRFKSCEVGPVILSAAKNLSPHPAQILRCAQNDRAI
ncbi:MAG TPA: hypothetical protein VKR42_02465 [Ktedonobacteraceae bacterium]|nr:hypothetical protein [Ktedonobacteraceae bacterium]